MRIPAFCALTYFASPSLSPGEAALLHREWAQSSGEPGLASHLHTRSSRRSAPLPSHLHTLQPSLSPSDLTPAHPPAISQPLCPHTCTPSSRLPAPLSSHLHALQPPPSPSALTPARPPAVSQPLCPSSSLSAFAPPLLRCRVLCLYTPTPT